MDLLHRYVEFHNGGGDFHALAELFHADGAMHFVNLPMPTLRGPQEIRAAFCDRPPEEPLSLVGEPHIEGTVVRAAYGWRQGGREGDLHVTIQDERIYRLTVMRDFGLASPENFAATVRAWEETSLPFEVWQRHVAHVAVALWHAYTYDEREATRRMREGIQRYNAAHGILTTPTGGYHETVTIASMQYILAYLDRADPSASLSSLFEGLLAIFPNSKVLLTYYTRDLIMSPEARSGWVEPDLQPIR